MTKIGLSLSMIGGILFFPLTYFFAKYFYFSLTVGEEGVLFFLFFLLIHVGAIFGAVLGFINKKIGYYLCLLIGIGFPLFLLLFSGPYFFSSLLFTLTSALYIPWWIIFVGGITSIIELRMELRKNKKNFKNQYNDTLIKKF